MVRHLILPLVFLLVQATDSVKAQGQEPDLPERSIVSALRWTDDDLSRVQPQSPLVPYVPKTKKSVILAAGMSLVLPGAGEIYTENYWLAPMFLALEATLWYFQVDYTNRGDEETSSFERFADGHWSVVRYAEWLNAYAKNFPGGANTQQIPISGDASFEPWERVNWAVMNDVESAIPQFSHRLPPHGDQQYYELIGKYFQYSYGWDDKTPTGDGWSDYAAVSPHFLAYAKMRGDANDKYNSASLFVNLIILNHVLSAVDAAFLAVRWNKDVDLQSQASLFLLPNGMAEIRPSTTFTLRF